MKKILQKDVDIMYLLLTIPVLFLFICIPKSFAETTYTRTPTGTTITSPVVVNFYTNDFVGDFSESSLYWSIKINQQGTNVEYQSSCYSSTTLSASYSFYLPVGEYNEVWVEGSSNDDGSCSVSDPTTLDLEYDNENTIFTIIGGTKIIPTPTNVFGSFGEVTTDVIDTVYPFMLIVIGIVVTFFVATRLVKNVIPTQDKYTYDEHANIKTVVFDKKKK